MLDVIEIRWVSHLQDIHDALVSLGTFVHLLFLFRLDAPLWSAAAGLPWSDERVVVRAVQLRHARICVGENLDLLLATTATWLEEVEAM